MNATVGAVIHERFEPLLQVAVRSLGDDELGHIASDGVKAGHPSVAHHGGYVLADPHLTAVFANAGELQIRSELAFDALFAVMLDDPFMPVRPDQRDVLLAQQLLRREAQRRDYARVDEGEESVRVGFVDDVAAAVDDGPELLFAAPQLEKAHHMPAKGDQPAALFVAEGPRDHVGHAERSDREALRSDQRNTDIETDVRLTGDESAFHEPRVFQGVVDLQRFLLEDSVRAEGHLTRALDEIHSVP